VQANLIIWPVDIRKCAAKEVLVWDREERCIEQDLTEQEDYGEYQLSEKDYARNDMSRKSFEGPEWATYTDNETFCG